jgi:hypothetical protein
MHREAFLKGYKVCPNHTAGRRQEGHVHANRAMYICQGLALSKNSGQGQILSDQQALQTTLTSRVVSSSQEEPTTHAFRKGSSFSALRLLPLARSQSGGRGDTKQRTYKTAETVHHSHEGGYPVKEASYKVVGTTEGFSEAWHLTLSLIEEWHSTYSAQFPESSTPNSLAGVGVGPGQCKA